MSKIICFYAEKNQNEKKEKENTKTNLLQQRLAQEKHPEELFAQSHQNKMPKMAKPSILKFVSASNNTAISYTYRFSQ